MEQFIQWLMSLDTTAITAAIIGLITTNAGTILCLAISSVKNKLKKAQLDEALANSKLELDTRLETKVSELKNDIINLLSLIQEDIMTKNEASQKARLEAIQSLANNVQTSNVELSEVTKNTTDINSILNDLE